MPEGHVIHRLAHALESTFGDTPVNVSSPQGRFTEQAARITGHPIAHADAVGKHLFIDVAAPCVEHIIHIHLGLIGTFRFSPLAPPTGQVRLRLADEETAADLRGPQWCRLITDDERHAAENKLGADPIRADADPSFVKRKVLTSSRTIGDLLMDQSLFAGVGNIYRAEVLFRHGINPQRTGTQLTGGDFDTIWDDLVYLMREGVTAGRIDTVYPEHTPEAMNRPPRKDDHGGEVYVYRRAGQPCHVCHQEIEGVAFKGRNLFYCPRCQQ